MKKRRILTLCLFLALAVISAVGVWKTVYINADIDESYALTMAHRIACGDRLFVTMWEPHQLSALLYAPVVWLYEAVRGTSDGILVFLRWIGVLVQLAVSICVWREFRKACSGPTAMGLAFLYFNFTPKHIQSPEFTSLCYWFLMLLILCLIRCETEEKKRFSVLSGVCMSALVLCYPFMLLLFIVCLVWFLGRRRRGDALLFAVTCLCLGLLTMLFLFAGGVMPQVLSNVPYVLTDASHRQDVLLTWKHHVSVIWEMLRVPLAAMVILQVGRPVLDRENRYGKPVLAALLLAEGIWAFIQFHTLEHVNFLICYPILFQMWLIGWYACGFFPHDEQKKGMFRISLIVSLTALFAILASSNLDANYSVPFLMPQLLFGLMMILDVLYGARRTEETPAEKAVKPGEKDAAVSVWDRKRKMDKISCVIGSAVILLFALQILTARVFLVRFTSTQHYNLFAGYYETHRGSLKGISLGTFDYQQYEAKMDALSRHVTAEDTFLYVGCDMFLYSNLNGAKIGSGNTISTPAFADQLVAYYEKYPDRIPTVMFVDREYGADFRTVLTQEPFRGFLTQYFDLDAPLSDGPVDVYRRRV